MARSPSVLTGTHRALTERDVVLLRCLAAGGSTGRIAVALSVSSNTVRTRIRRVQGKLGVSTRSQLVHAARALDLL
jgi:DNA-binding CsgD family transcriptional regulator